MNIIVRPYGSARCYCRPDTTWERENKDFYSPDCVDELYWTPVLFARVCKAGKCIGKKFVSRYYDSIGFGALLYIGHSDGSGEERIDIAFTSCADHTSLLPMPLYNPVVLEGKDNVFEVFRNSEPFWKSGDKALTEELEGAICDASALTSLRIGDFVAMELAPMELIASRPEGQVDFKAVYCGNDLYDFKIMF